MIEHFFFGRRLLFKFCLTFLGNFQTLLNFRIESGDEILKEHFETAPKNATYSSKTIQNEMIFCFGKYIRQAIVDEINPFNATGDYF